MAGVTVAGSLVADVIKMISHYPEKGMLADVADVSYGIGRCVFNTAVGVKKLDPSIEVKSIGLVGNDDKGQFLKEKLRGYGINTSLIKTSENQETSFSDVMTVKETGERTFFHHRGACCSFDEDTLRLDKLDAELVLLGYTANFLYRRHLSRCFFCSCESVSGRFRERTSKCERSKRTL